MKVRTFVRLGAAALLTSGVSVWAQTGPIRVFVDPGTGTFSELTSARADDGDPVTIDLTGLFPNGIDRGVTIHIYDEDTITTDCEAPWNVPTHSIGHITITGTVHSSPTFPPRLFVAVMHKCETFPGSPELPLARGCINFGGLSFSSGSEDLRDVARVAIAVSGDITGDVTAGHVFRVQAQGRMVSTTYTGGTISGNITATVPRFSDVSGNFDSVGVVWAGHELTGDVVATAEDPDGETTSVEGGSIGRVFVGVASNTAVAGITGDIKAEHGRIEVVHTAGPIGSVSVTPKIWAGLALHEVRVFDAASIGGGGTPTIGSADIKADIRNGLDIQNSVGAGPNSIDAHVYLVETDGDLTGAIDIANLTYPIAGARQYGIIVGGAVTAPINIRYNLEIADIIAASIDAPITIGVSAKGAIVATAENGQIVSVEIGYANEGLDPQDVGYDDRVEFYDAAYPRGFKGSACSPVNPNRVAPSGTYTHADWTTTVVNHCLDGSTPVPVDSGSVDSVIRASYIGSVRIAAMTDMYSFGTSLKSHFPRIESPEIGSLEIGLLRSGVIWSGNLTFEDDELVWDPAEAYANIGTITIGCIAQAGDLWVDGTTRIEIAGDVLGQIHVPTLTSTIWISGRLGLWSAFGASCANQGLGTGGLAYANEEDSPRDSTWTGEDTNARGEIVIREVGGLQGQIIINGNNDGGTWDGV
ncbi:MAG: hypothetical protein KF869_15030, partial [Phycisphaeraceae bacterium]|nr:hypothetical protein [Phycisphaeraceae bacterium]